MLPSQHSAVQPPVHRVELFSASSAPPQQDTKHPTGEEEEWRCKKLFNDYLAAEERINSMFRKYVLK